MSAHRDQFLLAHGAILATVGEAIVLDQGIGSTPHNERARLLRNGLAVMIFSSLEGFIRDRMIEIMRSIDPNVVPFSSLPEALQRIIAQGAIDGLQYKTRYMKAPDVIATILSEASFLGSLGLQSAYGVSALAFGRSKANISADDVKGALLALGVVGDVWENIRQISIRANLGGLVAPQTQFQALSRERNGAAHNSAHQVAIGTLIDHARNAFAIAIGFDILASTARNLLNSRATIAPIANSHSAIKLLVITQRQAAKWALGWSGAPRALRLGSSLNSMYLAAGQYRGDLTALLQFDQSGTPVAWRA